MRIREKSLGEIAKFILKQYGLAYWEATFFVHWFNPFATLYINFRCFPLRQAIHLPLWMYGHPSIYGLSGKMLIEGCKVRTGLVRFNITTPGAPSFMSAQSEIGVRGSIVFHGKCNIGCGTKIYVGDNGVLSIGGDTKITDFVNVGCFHGIYIGERTKIAHRCQLLDSNYHYLANMQKRIVLPWEKEIRIGMGVWVCNSTTITGGAVIPNYCVVASNSLVGKDFSDASDGTLIGGIPAKVLPAKSVRINNISWEQKINEWYSEHDASEPFVLPENVTMEELNNIHK